MLADARRLAPYPRTLAIDAKLVSLILSAVLLGPGSIWKPSRAFLVDVHRCRQIGRSLRPQ
jgi:hypothetical protein